jgi:flagellar protein FlaG
MATNFILANVTVAKRPTGSPALANKTDVSLPKQDAAVEEDKHVSDSNKLSRGEISAAVTALNQYMQSSNREIEFRLDESTGDTVVRITNQSTGELIRQIPSKVALQLAQDIHSDHGVLLNTKI